MANRQNRKWTLNLKTKLFLIPRSRKTEVVRKSLHCHCHCLFSCLTMKNNVTGVRIALESLVRSLPRVKVVCGCAKVWIYSGCRQFTYSHVINIGQKYSLDSIDQLFTVGVYLFAYYCFNVTLIHHSFYFNLSHS